MLGVELLELETNLLIKDLKPLKKDNDIMCECEDHKAKWILTDDFMNGWHMNLCDDCLLDMREDYKEEGTSYKVSLLK
ncbi:hypothetical protein [Cetobacterium sp. ZWU0022]|uniref:hypothetical protein n=1 Tax=Cetobacterium sp. ZWU0022 TaxID=1340502 RepID=UPI000648A7DB|nr:hypothetical protein [Cetobacterium sp. ZWU0022]